jgi:hypothetical protein
MPDNPTTSAIDELDELLEKFMPPAIAEALKIGHGIPSKLHHSLSDARYQIQILKSFRQTFAKKDAKK